MNQTEIWIIMKGKLENYHNQNNLALWSNRNTKIILINKDPVCVETCIFQYRNHLNFSFP